MEAVLLVVQLILAVVLIGLVLLQRSETDGFGLGSGSNMNLMSGRASANLMTRATAIMAALFIINSLVLSILAAHGRAPSIVDTIEQQQQSGVPAVPLAGAQTKPSADVKEPAAVSEKTAPAVPTDAAPVKKVTKKPVVKPADVTPTEPAETDDSNQ